VVERDQQLVDRVGPERVPYLRPVERDPHRRYVLGAVVGDVGELEALDGLPQLRLERIHATTVVAAARRHLAA